MCTRTGGAETGGDAATAAVSAHFAPNGQERPAADRAKTALQAVEAAQCGFWGRLLRLGAGRQSAWMSMTLTGSRHGLGGRRQLFLGNVPSHGDGDTVLQREYSGAGGGTQAAADAPSLTMAFIMLPPSGSSINGALHGTEAGDRFRGGPPPCRAACGKDRRFRAVLCVEALFSCRTVEGKRKTKRARQKSRARNVQEKDGLTVSTRPRSYSPARR